MWKLKQRDPLKGTKIYLDFPSVGATENILMAAVLAEGQTIIENAATGARSCWTWHHT